MITIVTCRYCGKAGLIWKKDKYGVWVLTENGVQKHVCKKTKNKRRTSQLPRPKGRGL